MTRNFVLVMGALVASAATAQGQASQCSSNIGPAVNACNTAVDLFNYMAPQLGSVVAGGNATLGQGGSRGGLGLFAASVRGTLVLGSLPQIQSNTPTAGGTATTGAPQTIDTKDQLLGLPAVDAAIGIFP